MHTYNIFQLSLAGLLSLSHLSSASPTGTTKDDISTGTVAEVAPPSIEYVTLPGNIKLTITTTPLAKYDPTANYTYTPELRDAFLNLSGESEGSSLQKRDRPAACWGFTLGYGYTRAQYISSVTATYNWLRGTGTFRTLAPWTQISYTNGNTNLLVINNSLCTSYNIADSTSAYYIQQFRDFCDDQKGWMLRAGIPDITFQLDQAGHPPPQYSPRAC